MPKVRLLSSKTVVKCCFKHKNLNFTFSQHTKRISVVKKSQQTINFCLETTLKKFNFSDSQRRSEKPKHIILLWTKLFLHELAVKNLVFNFVSPVNRIHGPKFIVKTYMRHGKQFWENLFCFLFQHLHILNIFRVLKSMKKVNWLESVHKEYTYSKKLCRIKKKSQTYFKKYPELNS